MARELLQPGTKPNELLQQDRRTSTADTVAKLYSVFPGNSIVERATQDNTVNLLVGAYPAFVPSKPDTTINGVAGTTVQSANISTAGCYVRGVQFTGAVVLTSTARTLFTNCRFDSDVQVAAGGQAVFTDCYFNGTTVNNAGAVGNVGVVGCRRTGALWANCTVLFDIG